MHLGKIHDENLLAVKGFGLWKSKWSQGSEGYSDGLFREKRKPNFSELGLKA